MLQIEINEPGHIAILFSMLNKTKLILFTILNKRDVKRESVFTPPLPQ